MTDPLSRSARAMIERAATDEGLLRADDVRRARLERALLSGLAATGTGLLGSSASQAAMGAQATSSGVAQLLPLVKGLGVGLLLSGAVAGGLHLAAAPSSPPPPALARSSNVAMAKREPLPAIAGPAAPPSSLAPVASSAPPKARVAVAAASAASSEPSASPGSTLRAELELMSQVQTALRDSRGAHALLLLERYDEAFPRGQLGTERLAAEVLAACQVGDVARAGRAASQFLQRDASSRLAERVKGSCIDSERAR